MFSNSQSHVLWLLTIGASIDGSLYPGEKTIKNVHKSFCRPGEFGKVQIRSKHRKLVELPTIADSNIVFYEEGQLKKYDSAKYVVDKGKKSSSGKTIDTIDIARVVIVDLEHFFEIEIVPNNTFHGCLMYVL